MQENLHGLIQQHRVDFCVANVENAAAGFGITPEIAEAWAKFYRNEALRNAANPSALGRAELMEEVMYLLSE